ncbi:MAG: hypothetical protein ACTSV7_14925 [Candidatus Baldrarchaeia archaeon]
MPEEEEKPKEEVTRAEETVWHKYKNLLFIFVAGTFIAYQLGAAPLNLFIGMLIITIIVYLYSQAEKRGIFGIGYRLPDVLEEAEKIRNLLLEVKGWRLELDAVLGHDEYGPHANTPLVIYYRYRKYNEETGGYTDWLIVKQSVFDRNNKNCGIVDIKPLSYKPIETRKNSWSGAIKAGGYYGPEIIYKTVEKPIIRAPPEEEELEYTEE